MNNVDRRIKQINTENFIWIIYFFLIGLCLYANYYEKKYFLEFDKKSKEKYRNLTIFIFIIAVIIYFYFFIDNYNDFNSSKKNNNLKQQTLNELSLLGSTLVLISGLIFLYIAIVDVDLDVELAFN
jgi:heme/copper-type cytochrome/quinol oxidase subunit 3